MAAPFVVQSWPADDTVQAMVKRILIAGLAVLIIGYFALFAYQRYRTNQRLNSGEISGQDAHGGNVTTEEGEDVQPRLSRSDTQQAPPRRQGASSASQTSSASAAMTVQATDSIAPDPPNGMAFTGSGRFQVYRQGNLTWRVNTDNGSACILFATNEEWRKPVVYSHGCGTS